MKRFSCPGPTRSVLVKLDESELLECLGATYERAYDTDLRLRDCRHFEFLHSRDIEAMAARDSRLSDYMFWRIFGLLVIFNSRTTAAATQELFDAIMWSIGAKNPLALALAGRALIEHASAASNVASHLAKIREHLHAEVWPNLNPESPPKPTDGDRDIAAVLTKHALGRRIEVSAEELRRAVDLGVKYKDLSTHLEDSVPKHLRVRSCLSDIDAAGKASEQHCLRLVYDWLSEYCHANSAARSFAFTTGKQTESGHRRTHSTSLMSPGFLQVFRLIRGTNGAVRSSCWMLDWSFASLQDAMRPMPSSDRIAKDDKPPRGAIAAVDDHGRKIWVDVGQIRESAFRPADLAPDQIRRLERV